MHFWIHGKDLGAVIPPGAAVWAIGERDSRDELDANGIDVLVEQDATATRPQRPKAALTKFATHARFDAFKMSLDILPQDWLTRGA